MVGDGREEGRKKPRGNINSSVRVRREKNKINIDAFIFSPITSTLHHRSHFFLTLSRIFVDFSGLPLRRKPTIIVTYASLRTIIRSAVVVVVVVREQQRLKLVVNCYRPGPSERVWKIRKIPILTKRTFARNLCRVWTIVRCRMEKVW